jgi:hypothetical protein
VSTDARSEASARTLLGAAAASVLLGIALCLVDQPMLGGWLSVLSLGGMLVALHRFGRSGADAPARLERRRKRRKRKAKAPRE